MILSSDEHRPDPPDRVLGYWLAVAYYGRQETDQWIEELPFKSPPDRPWKGTNMIEELARIPNEFNIHRDWITWFNNIKEKHDNGQYDEFLGLSGLQ